MANLDKDLTLLLHMKGYCKEIIDTLSIINNSYDEYNKNFIVRNSLCMDLLQIGELENRLSSKFKKETQNEIEWHKIHGMRNRFAHEYIKIDYDIVFDVVTKDIPELNEFLTKVINKYYTPTETGERSVDDNHDDYDSDI